MEGRNRRLQDVVATAAEGEGAVELAPPRGDLVDVPEGAILVTEEDDRALGEAGLAPGVVQEHQRQQAVHLGLVRHQLGKRASEPDRLGREVSAAAVALVEDQVDDCEDRRETVGEEPAAAGRGTGSRRP